MRFGRWLVTDASGRKWDCICACGTSRKVDRYSLKSGASTSCGCLRGEELTARNQTHKLSGTPEYRVYHAMKDRCYRESDKEYENYGGRGIKVSDDWLTGFQAFIRDMGPRPTRRHTLERKNVNLGYSASNCVWATPTQQARNRRATKVFTVMCITAPAYDLAEHFKVKKSIVRDRLRRGWCIEDALFRVGRYKSRRVSV